MCIRRSHQRGQSAVEVGITIALIAAVALLSLRVTGTRLDQVFCRVVGAFGGSCGLLLSDDFNNLDAWQRVSGNWRNENGQLCGGPREGRIFTPLNANDYVIDLGGAALSQGDGYGVFFRADNVNRVNGYTFQYDPGLRGVAFRKWVNGNEISVPLARATLPDYAWYSQDRQIQVVVNGDTFTALIDGQPVLSVTDSTYPTGSALGLRTWDNTVACFDQLRVAPAP
ncbi:MAG: DUF1080 domain-containing protein [Candidatus Viridilinea halotolerans]|uniref:DUF1080 domain-containing protein n=1 Tax=Candidatus Viridilinea halotolerans TaxID=2491704 RepID=A0A426TTZ0_9CHLR|nr:MAG: DUF1080 domain-containing protein [Candidatus Viridilinea halotolerans]